MHSHRAPSWKITCRTVQVLPECLRLSTIPAVHCNVATKGVSLGIQYKPHSPNEWASWLPSNPKKKLTIHVRRLCCSRAPRAVQQRVPLDRASVTRCSAAWSMAAGGSPCRTRQTFQRDKATRQPRQTKNKRIQGQANLQKIRAGREDVTVARCVFTDGTGSTLQSLVTSVG